MPTFTVYKGSKAGTIHKSQTTREIQRDEVLVKITHSGLCGTDLHYKDKEMGIGHEGVGTIAELGSAVDDYKIGDRVGWGYLHAACGRCKQCLTGRETLCPERKLYASDDLDQGSMGEYAVWKAAYLFRVPDGIDSRDAAPLMCGGATVYSALARFGLKTTDRVGIIGIGGLGHLAIQFAAKMGCTVVVFSSSEDKKAEAMSLGASEFYATKGIEKFPDNLAIDQLLISTSQQPNWELYLPTLAPAATVLPLTVSFEDLRIPYIPFLMNEYRIQGSVIAARAVHREMLDFAAHHSIKPIVEEFPMSEEGIAASIKKLEDGKMRYRGVLIV